MRGWQLGLMAKENHLKTLKKLQSSDYVLQVLRFKLIGAIQGSISTPAVEPSTQSGINRIIQLLR